jgi:hypothetical protein
MIEFSWPIIQGKVTVKLDGKLVGEIRQEADGFRYFPKGQKTGGELFSTLPACKKSLTDE